MGHGWSRREQHVHTVEYYTGRKKRELDLATGPWSAESLSSHLTGTNPDTCTTIGVGACVSEKAQRGTPRCQHWRKGDYPLCLHTHATVLTYSTSKNHLKGTNYKLF